MRPLLRLIFWLIALPLGVAVILFALSNRQAVQLAFWPFEDGVDLPAYVAVLVPLLAGLVIGLFTGAGRRLAAQARARALSHRVAILERKLEAARQSRDDADPAPISEDIPLPP